MSTKKSAEQRYREKLIPQPGGCIDWRGSIDKYGNAKFGYTIEGRSFSTSGHRFGWVLIHGPIPDGMRLKNTCGSGSCQNLDHWSLVLSNLGTSVDQKYESKFTCGEADECWPWQGQSRDKDGYGLFSYRQEGKVVSMRAHRYAWERVNGPIPNGLVICHTCDNPPCQNLGHLFVGTHQDNSDDMHAKGRGVSGFKIGAAHYKAVLTEAIVRELRSRYTGAYGEQAALARELGVSLEAAKGVFQGKSWKHVK